jgi:hypothetical protein
VAQRRRTAKSERTRSQLDDCAFISYSIAHRDPDVRTRHIKRFGGGEDAAFISRSRRSTCSRSDEQLPGFDDAPSEFLVGNLYNTPVVQPEAEARNHSSKKQKWMVEKVRDADGNVKVCDFWRKRDSCTKGEACVFRHESTDV